MCTSELRMKTKMADTRMGSQRAGMGTMRDSYEGWKEQVDMLGN
jgi:hypothetical protein